MFLENAHIHCFRNCMWSPIQQFVLFLAMTKMWVMCNCVEGAFQFFYSIIHAHTRTPACKIHGCQSGRDTCQKLTTDSYTTDKARKKTT